MADLRDYTKKNPVFVGTDGIRLPTGNNAQRTASSNVAGTMRFNTDIDGIETYTSGGWRPLAAPPSINSVSPSVFSGESGTLFTINGEAFTPDAQVYFVTSNSTLLLASTVTYMSPVQLRATTPRNIKVEEEPLSVRVVQQSGTTTKLNCIDAGGNPTWITTAGTLGSIFGANTVNVYVSATDPEGTSVTYQISSGSLPNGLQLSANGLVQGLANSVLANTTYNFVIKANDTVNNNTDRSFSYTILNRAPVINTAAGLIATFYSGNAVPSTTISAYDPDGGQLVYTAPSGNIVNTTIGSANGTIVGTPIVVTTNTTYTIGVTVTDEGSLTASNTYTFTVLNRPPVWNSAASLTNITDDNIDTYVANTTVNAFDPDGGSITYTLSSGSIPAGMSFISANGALAGAPIRVDSNTTSTFTVTATDIGNDSNTRTFTLTVEHAKDENFANTILLIHGNANTVIKDASSDNRPLNVYADARASNFSPYNTSWSNYFDGTGDYLLSSAKTPIDWMLSSGNSGTIEAFIYPTSYKSHTNNYQMPSIVGLGATYLNFGVTSTGVLRLYWWTGAANTLDSSVTIPLNQWTHVAVVVNGTGSNNIKLYVNGLNVGTGTFTNISWASSSGGNNLYVGAEESATSSSAWPGFISNLRISNNAVYTANFTPGTATLTTTANTTLLTCHNNRFYDVSNVAVTLTRNGDVKVVGWSPFAETDTTTGSMYFDGTGDYVQMLTPYNFGTNNFTVEGWFYLNSLSGALWGASNGGGITSKFQAYISTGTLGIDFNGTSIISVTAASYLKAYSWNHMAVCRGGTGSGQTALFINGVRAGTGTMGSQTGITTNFGIGYMELGAMGAGYISNFRIVDGTDVYGYTNTTYTVPTSPLTAITNTKLLTLQSRQPHNNHGLQDQSNSKFLIVRSGNATQGTFTPYGKAWSYYQTGSSFVAFNSTNSRFAMGSSDVTIEFGVNMISGGALLTTYQWNAGGRGGWEVYTGTDGNLSVYPQGGSSASSGAGFLDRYKWTHVAITRTGSTWKFYKNGQLFSTATISFTFDNPSGPHGNYLRIGAHVTDGNTIESPSTIRISDIRISNTVRYSANFTPQRVETSDANTVLLTAVSNRYYDLAYNENAIEIRGTPELLPDAIFPTGNVYSPLVYGGSMYVDGTGDYCVIQSGSELGIGANDFTVELFWYPKSWPSGSELFSAAAGDGTGRCFAMYAYNSNGTLAAFAGTGGSTWDIVNTLSMGTAVLNQWNHMAFTRSGNTFSTFLNGSRISTTTASGTLGSKNIGVAAAYGGGSVLTTGYLSGCRLITGTSLYNSATYTIPTSPPTPIANTKVLLNFTNAALIDHTGKTMLETVGDTKSNNSISKFSGGSAWFDGSGDYLYSTKMLPIGNGDVTIECWVYFTSVSSSSEQHIVQVDGSATNILLAQTAVSSTPKLRFLLRNESGTSNLDLNSNITVSAGVWYHLAGVISGTNGYFFVNGSTTDGATGTVTGTRTATGTTLTIGRNTDGARQLTGAVQEIRVTRGSARYTSNFTVPTKPFPNR